jgi:hypothetical protein
MECRLNYALRDIGLKHSVDVKHPPQRRNKGNAQNQLGPFCHKKTTSKQNPIRTEPDLTKSPYDVMHGANTVFCQSKLSHYCCGGGKYYECEQKGRWKGNGLQATFTPTYGQCSTDVKDWTTESFPVEYGVDADSDYVAP